MSFTSYELYKLRALQATSYELYKLYDIRALQATGFTSYELHEQRALHATSFASYKLCKLQALQATSLTSYKLYKPGAPTPHLGSCSKSWKAEPGAPASRIYGSKAGGLKDGTPAPRPTALKLEDSSLVLLPLDSSKAGDRLSSSTGFNQ